MQLWQSPLSDLFSTLSVDILELCDLHSSSQEGPTWFSVAIENHMNFLEGGRGCTGLERTAAHKSMIDKVFTSKSTSAVAFAAGQSNSCDMQHFQRTKFPYYEIIIVSYTLLTAIDNYVYAAQPRRLNPLGWVSILSISAVHKCNDTFNNKNRFNYIDIETAICWSPKATMGDDPVDIYRYYVIVEGFTSPPTIVVGGEIVGWMEFTRERAGTKNCNYSYKSQRADANLLHRGCCRRNSTADMDGSFV